MKLSREQVLHIAELAKLELTDRETELFAEQLSEILNYAELLNQLDTDAIPPTAQVLDRQNIFRSDSVKPSLSPDRVLANAPDQQDNYFRVERVLEE